MRFELAPFARPDGYGEAIVPLADVKDHVSIEQDETEFDELLSLFRDAAVDMVESYCEVRLAPCEGLVWRAEQLPARVLLSVSPVTAITGIGYLDADGVEQEGDATLFRLAIKDEVVPKAGQSWPAGITGGITITFTAGFTAANRPPTLVQAVKMFAAHLFANREAASSGTISGEIPLGFRMLCARHVRVRV